MASLIDLTLSKLSEFLQLDKLPSDTWIDYFLWYNLCGVQYIIGYMDVNHIDPIQSDKKFLDCSAMTVLSNVHSININFKSELKIFILAVESAVNAVILSLQ